MCADETQLHYSFFSQNLSIFSSAINADLEGLVTNHALHNLFINSFKSKILDYRLSLLLLLLLLLIKTILNCINDGDQLWPS